MRQTYRQEEVEQILGEAARRASTEEAFGEVSHERLLAMAEELGVDPALLEAVLRDREAGRGEEQRRIAEERQNSSNWGRSSGAMSPMISGALCPRGPRTSAS